MTFIVRQISRTADGREIVRTATHDKASISVGRDASSEIHLADLAVELHHARLTISASGRVDVESTCGLAFGVDGVSNTHVDVDPASGAELSFGGHRIGVSFGEGAVRASIIQSNNRAWNSPIFQ